MAKYSTTYWPYNGSLYKGDMGKPHINVKHAEQYNSAKIGDMRAVPTAPQLAASTFSPKHAEAQLLTVSGSTFTTRLSGPMHEAAAYIHAETQYEKSNWGVDPATAAQMQARHASALNADIDENISHVRTIPRIQQIIGMPPNMYYAEQAFTPIPVPELDARVSEQDANSMELQKDPTERAAADHVRFIEHRFHLRRNSMAIVWSSEAQMRADINLVNRDLETAVIAKARARELLALVACEGLSTDSNMTISALAATGTGTIPRAENNPTEEIANIRARFLTERSAMLTHMIWNPVDFASLLSNYFAMQTALTTADNPGYGLTTVPKNPGLTAVISPMCPRGYVYGLDKRSAMVGEGPYVTEVERDAGIYADRAYVHDFVQFLIHNPARFGVKIQLTLPGGTSRGTEWTLERARNSAAAPATLASETYEDGTFE